MSGHMCKRERCFWNERGTEASLGGFEKINRPQFFFQPADPHIESLLLPLLLLLLLLARFSLFFLFGLFSACVLAKMENHNFFPAAPRSKRKYDDSDAVLELLHGVSLSPDSKKLRQEFGSSNDITMGSCNVSAPEVELCDQIPNDMMLGSPDVDIPDQLVEPLSSASVNDERAIVLYKPVNPPLFPGGPSAGSQFLLNASILSSGVLDASNMLRNRKEDKLSWLQAPKSGVKIVELTEEEANQLDLVQDNRLAVVPWESNSPLNMLASQTAGQPSSVDIGMCGDDESVGVEAMEEDNDSSMDFVNSQPSNSSTSFCYEPWQQYGAPQPQYSSLMWSH